MANKTSTSFAFKKATTINDQLKERCYKLRLREVPFVDMPSLSYQDLNDAFYLSYLSLLTCMNFNVTQKCSILRSRKFFLTKNLFL